MAKKELSARDIKVEGESAGSRKLPRYADIARFILIVIGVSAAIYQIFGYTVRGFIMWPRSYFLVLIGCFIPLVLLTVPHRKGITKLPWFDILAGFVMIGCCAYMFVNTQNIDYQSWQYFPPRVGIVVAFLFSFIVLETVRRTAGSMFFTVCIVFFLFPLFTEYLPGLLHGVGFNLVETVSYYIFGMDAVFGLVMNVMGNLLIGFLLFAVVLNYSGGGKFFLDLAFAMVGGTRGGPAKVAVLASGFMGSMSGSVVSNVITTGAITIPAMKKLGYPAHYAGAVEACASTGAVLMPPVMGTTAFIMAQVLGISYGEIAIAATIPSLLYYASLMFQVDATSVKLGMKGLPKSEIPSLKKVLFEGWPFLFSLLALLFMLFYLRRAALAPFYATGVLVVTVFVWKFRSQTRAKWIESIYAAGESISMLMPIMLGVGFIIGALITTGVAGSFSDEVIKLAGGNAVLLLLLGAFVSFILGMAMSVTAVYIFLAMTVAPPLVALGFDSLAVHLFVMYNSMLSAITPPVALAVFAAASIANSSQLKTGLTAIKIGFVLFLLPFAFVAAPSIIFRGPILITFLHVFTFLAGIYFAIGCIEGYMVGLGHLKPWARIAAVPVTVLLVAPTYYLTGLGVFLGLALALALYILNSRRQRPDESERIVNPSSGE
jgi:TRAP transporter 4TM/12TM fusion protein